MCLELLCLQERVRPMLLEYFVVAAVVVQAVWVERELAVELVRVERLVVVRKGSIARVVRIAVDSVEVDSRYIQDDNPSEEGRSQAVDHIDLVDIAEHKVDKVDFVAVVDLLEYDREQLEQLDTADSVARTFHSPVDKVVLVAVHIHSEDKERVVDTAVVEHSVEEEYRQEMRRLDLPENWAECRQQQEEEDLHLDRRVDFVDSVVVPLAEENSFEIVL
jgi:hypothetical protein